MYDVLSSAWKILSVTFLLENKVLLKDLEKKSQHLQLHKSEVNFNPTYLKLTFKVKSTHVLYATSDTTHVFVITIWMVFIWYIFYNIIIVTDDGIGLFKT